MCVCVCVFHVYYSSTNICEVCYVIQGTRTYFCLFLSPRVGIGMESDRCDNGRAVQHCSFIRSNFVVGVENKIAAQQKKKKKTLL